MSAIILKDCNDSVQKEIPGNNFAGLDDVTLLQNVIHDLKMSLSLIYIDISELEKSESISTDDAKHIKRVKKNYYRMMKLVNDTCDASRISSGNFKLNYEKQDVVSLIKELADCVQGIAQSRNIEFFCEFDVKQKIVSMDTEMFERILLNLISNAFKYTETGGAVQIIFKDLKERIQISVRDDGKGFSKSVLNYCFNRYITEYSERNSKGWGIGLSIVSQLVEAMSGEIIVRNLNHGAEVTLIFPTSYEGEAMPNKILAINDFYKDNMIEIEMSDM